jgi:hypothetical protein
MNITTTIEQINQGFNVQNEYDILPVYYDGQLMNGAVYNAYRFKRFMNHVGAFATHAYDTIKQQDMRQHIANHPVAATMIGITALALGDKIFG